MTGADDRLAPLLDGRRPDWHGDPDADAALVRLATLARDLRDLPTPDPDPQFRAALRDTLMVQAARTLPDAATAPRRPAVLSRIPHARAALVTAAAVTALAVAGGVAASAGAKPGDALYGVKRTSEDVQLALTGGTAEAKLRLDHAHRRAVEAATVTGADLDAVLDDLDADVHAGVSLFAQAAVDRTDAGLLDPVDTAVADIRGALWVATAPAQPSGRSRIAGSLDLLDDVDLRVVELRRSLDLGCASSARGDELGPLPGDCVALPPPAGADRDRAEVSGVPPAVTDIAPPDGDAPGALAPGDNPGDKPDGGDEPDGGGEDPQQPASPGLLPSPEPTDGPEEPDDDGGLLGGLGDLIDGLLGG